jgi:hypothetical protein
MPTIAAQNIQGAWLLESFQIEDLDKKASPWGNGAHGLLIYTDSGHMSVSINRELAAKFTVEAENIFDSILFYSGTYQIEGATITHQVTNASNPKRIGKQMLRYAELEGDLLTLASPQESFGRAILKWRRV